MAIVIKGLNLTMTETMTLIARGHKNSGRPHKSTVSREFARDVLIRNEIDWNEVNKGRVAELDL